MPEPDSHDDFMHHWLANQARICAYIRALVFERSEADDVLQEVASVLWRKFEEFEPGTHFDRWAMRVAHNQILYYFQKKRRETLVFSRGLMDELTSDFLEQRKSEGDYLDVLEHCLAKLAERDLALVRRRFQPGETNRSVAREVGKSESVVSRSLNRIYLALLQCIDLNLGSDGTAEAGR
jgi:RNA polymerase sigma-70 factor (ECF subfamily)